MAEYIIQKETLTEIANKIRILSEDSSSLSPSAMATSLADLNTEAEQQYNLINQIKAALVGKSLDDGQVFNDIVDEATAEEMEVVANGSY